MRAAFRPTLLVMTALSLSSCTVRARRPDGPYREAQELVDALSDLAVACTRENARPDSGQVIVTATLTPAQKAPAIDSEGSSAGSDAVIACVRKRAQEKLRNPEAVPAPRARVRVPLPLITTGVSYTFVKDPPDAGTPP